ncbi:MAG: FAD-dependent monooxygenase [Acidimicrobiia bacterium]|nr:FAD-dependent monooxygenase [Acidimicrobiia bacterium]
MSRQVTIVGAGPAGSVLATFLGRQGHSVTVYESRPDLRQVDIDAGRSINLALATRGIVVLEELGLLDDVVPLLIPMQGRMIHDAEGNQTLQPYGSRPEEVIYSVGRNELNAVLLDAAEASGEVEIIFNQRCVGGDLPGGVLRFYDGLTDTEYDVGVQHVFGADGFGSEIRDLIQEHNTGTELIEPLGHGYKEITLPAGPDGQHVIDANALHIWPRGDFMLIALADSAGTFTCTLFAPNEDMESLDSAEAVMALFEGQFPDFVPLVPDLADQYLANPAGRLATLRVTEWQLGDRAVVLGDAAHAIVPFHGQGMNAAIESVKVLMACLDGQADWAAAFETFERVRRPDTDAIADMALDNYIEMRSSVQDEGYQLRRELALELERRVPDKFIPRYAMVMFNTMPYSEVQRKATVQAALLKELTVEATTLDDVDLDMAAKLAADIR